MSARVAVLAKKAKGPAAELILFRGGADQSHRAGVKQLVEVQRIFQFVLYAKSFRSLRKISDVIHQTQHLTKHTLSTKRRGVTKSLIHRQRKGSMEISPTSFLSVLARIILWLFDALDSWRALTLAILLRQPGSGDEFFQVQPVEDILGNPVAAE